MMNLSDFSKDQVDVERLAQVIRERGRPVDATVLARAAVRAFLETHGERTYAPGAAYAVGERILLDGQPAEVRAVRVGGNPGQGTFTVLTLRLADGPEQWMAAEVTGAQAQDRDVTDERIRSLMNEKVRRRIRTAVKAALDADKRFASFQFERGNTWCLKAMLPVVESAALKRAAAALPQGWEGGEAPKSESTEALVRAVWGIENDGSAQYELAEFALSLALKQCADVESVGGDRWGWKADWDAFAQRDAVRGPRMPTQITAPEGITEEVAVSDHAREIPIRVEVDRPEEEKDLEAWHEDHPTMAVFTLSASQYYGAWLPLNKDLRKLFPPLEAGKLEITLWLNLLGYQARLPARVDMYKGQILGDEKLYDALRNQGVYPGARLRLAFVRVGEYEVATRPADKTGPIRVVRIRLEDGQPVAEEFEEERRYDIEDDVFVADARFEDLKALFLQAEGVGNSIFGLMYEKCKGWWEAQGRKELRVTAQQLFDAIHRDTEEGRMTSAATVAWELWRREAFQPKGGGWYRFCPERMDAIKTAVRAFSMRRAPREAQRETTPERTLGRAVAETQAEEAPQAETMQPEPATAPVEEAAQRPEADEVWASEAAAEPTAVMQVEEAVAQPALAKAQVEEGAWPAEAMAAEAVVEEAELEAGGGQPDVMAAEPEATMEKAEAPAPEPESVALAAEAEASPVEAVGAGPGGLELEAGAQAPDTPAAGPQAGEPEPGVTAPQRAVAEEGAEAAEEKAQAETAGAEAGAGATQGQRAEPRRGAGTPKEPDARGEAEKAVEDAAGQREPRKRRGPRSRRPKGRGQRIWETFTELPPVRWLMRLIRRK